MCVAWNLVEISARGIEPRQKGKQIISTIMKHDPLWRGTSLRFLYGSSCWHLCMEGLEPCKNSNEIMSTMKLEPVAWNLVESWASWSKLECGLRQQSQQWLSRTRNKIPWSATVTNLRMGSCRDRRKREQACMRSSSAKPIWSGSSIEEGTRCRPCGESAQATFCKTGASSHAIGYIYSQANTEWWLSTARKKMPPL